jgi:exopolysaccharide production protein ExoQ
LCCILQSRSDGRWRIPSAFLTLTLFRSLSKTTLVAFLVAQGYRLLRDAGLSRRKKLLIILGTVVLVASFWSLIDAYYAVYTTSGDQAETLTGRTAIWAWTLNAAVDKPVVGNGIDAMWKVAPPFGGEMFEARHAENELLQQFFAYGAIGVAMLGAIYGTLWSSFRRVADRSERAAFMALLLFVLVRGFAEAEPFDLLLPLWMITAVSLLLGASLRRIQQNARPETEFRIIVNCAD